MAAAVANALVDACGVRVRRRSLRIWIEVGCANHLII